MLLIVTSCNKNGKSIDLKITNYGLNVEDSLNLKITNYTEDIYLFYLNDKKLHSVDMPLSFFTEISHEDILVTNNYSFSSPFWMLDENGKMSEEDSLLQNQYFDCINRDTSQIIILKPNQVKSLKLSLIDSVDECGRINYPLLKKGVLYKTSIKLRIDSNLIPQRGMEKINKIRKETKVKLFQGQIESNSVDLRS